MLITAILGLLYIFWDYFYWIKWAAASTSLWLKKVTQRKRFDLYDFDAVNKPEKLGIVIPDEEKKWESPQPEEHLETAADEVFIYGINSSSEALIVRVSRAPNGESEAWIYLKLGDGRIYELEQTKGYQRNCGTQCTSFSCGGLEMYPLSEMRRWRIVFSGMLRERTQREESSAQQVFVKFTFIWTASSEIYDATSDLPIASAARAMAQAKWESYRPPVSELSNILNFYAQSGVITGVVSIEDDDDNELYLFGERIRNLGDYSLLKESKFNLILGAVPETGLILHVANSSITHLFENMHIGFVVNPSSETCTVENGLEISRTSDRNFTATFKTGDQHELSGIFADKPLHFDITRNYKEKMEVNYVTFDIDGYKGFGFFFSGEISKQPSNVNNNKISHKRNIVLPPTSSLTVCFTDEESLFTEVSGGKGGSLGKLTKLSKEINSEIIVPKGVIVTTKAYSKFLTPALTESIDVLRNIAYCNIKGDIHKACKIVQTEFENALLPDILAEDIANKLKKVFGSNVQHLKFAVRSSATGEDTDQMSAAGQMETFLGVKGITEIYSAVIKCWASQFSYIAVEYKRQNGQILNSPMAVVIQEMVECDSSGVLFTCDPVTNNPSVITITANYGLGESVVSGSEEPDTVALEKLSDGTLQVKSIAVGQKKHRIILKGEESSVVGGTVTEEIPEEKRVKCCISDEMSLKLGKIALQIEHYYKSPRDIEWGIKEGNIYILQSRPVTTGAGIIDHEIMHEFDIPLRCEGDFYTVCNVGEVMPGTISTLGLDILSRYFSLRILRSAVRKFIRNKFFQMKYFPIGFGTFYNHLHMGVIDLLTQADEDVHNSDLGKSMMIGVFGRLLDDPEIKKVASYRKYRSVNRSILLHLKQLLNLFVAGLGIEGIKKEAFSYQHPALKGRESKEIFELFIHTCSDMIKTIDKHMICSEVSALWNMQMFTILASAKGSVDSDVYSDFAKLLSSSSKVESADVPSAMQHLASTIESDIGSKRLKEMSVEEAQKFLETSPSIAGVKYREFLKRHGHRCLQEADVHSITWMSDPKSLIKILQNLSGSCKDVLHKEEATFSRILPQLNIPLTFKSRLLLKFILPNSRRALRDREICKSNLIKFIDNTRKAVQHLGKAMMAEGYLPDMDLLYFLNLYEIKDLLETRNPRILARAKHRRKLYPVMDTLKFPEISRGRPMPVNKQNNEEFQNVADLTMKGIPVSQGTVKGYARVALTLEEAAELKLGEILITYSTDIGWSPYFPVLSGVVTELGGLISHGAVVSREYGLPCVVGLHGATKNFKTGDYVLLDGNKGILQRLKPPEI